MMSPVPNYFGRNVQKKSATQVDRDFVADEDSDSVEERNHAYPDYTAENYGEDEMLEEMMDIEDEGEESPTR